MFNTQYLKVITFADLSILIIAASLLVWSYWYYWSNGTVKKYAVISMPNQSPLQVALGKPKFINIQGKKGISTIEIQPEKIRFIASPCHNKYCIHAGWQKQAGDFTACLPNQVSIEIHGQQAIQLDSIAY